MGFGRKIRLYQNLYIFFQKTDQKIEFYVEKYAQKPISECISSDFFVFFTQKTLFWPENGPF